MAISYKTEVMDNVLIITSSGEDESLQQVKEYASSLIKEAVQIGCKKVIIDEREIKYNLSVTDTYQLAEYITENAPNVCFVAVVANPEGIDDLSFWETVITNRGLRVKACHSMEEAEEWLGINKPIEMEIKIDQDLLLVSASGTEPSLDAYEEYLTKIIQAAIDTQCKKIILDIRNLAFFLDTDDFIQLSEFIKTEVPNVWGVAVINSPENSEDFKTLEEYLQNAGENIHFFIDYDRAMEWVNS